MQPASAAAETAVSQADYVPSTIVQVAAVLSLVWFLTVVVVCSIGYVQIRRYYSKPQPPARFQPDDAPDVTIIRPLKGLEPRLYDCLASTFRQDYPKEKLHIRLCVSSRQDPCVPIIQEVLKDFPGYDAQLLIEEEDEALQDGRINLGPNPKIRNMSRAYREAPGDLIWIIDCNVWAAKGVCGRMVAKLIGRGEKQRAKYVHQLPIMKDIDGTATAEESRGLRRSGMDADAQIRTTNTASASLQKSSERTPLSIGGGRLEEQYLASMHPKFYLAINTVAVAPCSIGKSTMWRKSHLNAMTNNAGIDYFSENIAEDQLMVDLFWYKKVPEQEQGEKMCRSALLTGDLGVQPMANLSMKEYWSRRIRWLRVRKYTVSAATFVEPGTESLCCALYGAFAVTTVPFFHDILGVPQTWYAFWLFWITCVTIWCFMDWSLYLKLHSGETVEVDEHTPFFAKPPDSTTKRHFGEWLLGWLGREVLALPVWVWGWWGGGRVEWRGKQFWVGMDMKVHEITPAKERPHINGTLGMNGTAKKKR